MFEKGQPGPLGITFVPQRVVESAPSHLNIPHQFGQSAIAIRDARNPELYSGLYAGASASGATSSTAPLQFQGIPDTGEVRQRDPPTTKESPNPTRQKKAKPEEQQAPPQVPKMPAGPPAKTVKETLPVKTFKTGIPPKASPTIADAVAAAKGAPKATPPDLSQGPPAKGAPTIADAVAASLPAKASQAKTTNAKLPAKGAPTIADVVADAMAVGLVGEQQPRFQAPELQPKASPKKGGGRRN